MEKRRERIDSGAGQHPGEGGCPRIRFKPRGVMNPKSGTNLNEGANRRAGLSPGTNLNGEANRRAGLSPGTNLNEGANRRAGLSPKTNLNKAADPKAAAALSERTQPEGATKAGSGFRRAKRAAAEVYKGLLQLLYPLRCPVCDGIVRPSGEKICLECLGRLKLLTPPWCMKCGKRLAEEGEFCADCRRIQHLFRRGRALYEYESAAPSIYRFKYGGRREYADFFGEQVAEYLGDFVRSVDPDALIPIPLHRKRKAVRGYNQAESLARAIGSRLEVPVCADCLVRVKNTVPLKYENPEERQNNLQL